MHEKIPKRTNERYKRKSHTGHKNRERGNTTIFFTDPSLCFKVARVLQRDFSYHSSITKWGPYTIELGLYIPMMSLLKRALGLREQASWMHPHYFHWRASFHSSYVHPLHVNPYSSHHIYNLAFSRL